MVTTERVVAGSAALYTLAAPHHMFALPLAAFAAPPTVLASPTPVPAVSPAVHVTSAPAPPAASASPPSSELLHMLSEADDGVLMETLLSEALEQMTEEAALGVPVGVD